MGVGRVLHKFNKSAHLHQIGNFLPLLFCWIDTGRVVSTRLQNNDGIFRRIAQIFHHTFKIKSLFSIIQVAIRAVSLETRTCKDEFVVFYKKKIEINLIQNLIQNRHFTPRRIGRINNSKVADMGEKLGSNTKSSASTYTLHAKSSTLIDRR